MLKITSFYVSVTQIDICRTKCPFYSHEFVFAKCVYFDSWISKTIHKNKNTYIYSMISHLPFLWQAWIQSYIQITLTSYWLKPQRWHLSHQSWVFLYPSPLNSQNQLASNMNFIKSETNPDTTNICLQYMYACRIFYILWMSDIDIRYLGIRNCWICV